MATIAFSAFLPEVMPSVPGCTDILALNAVRNACIDFCSSTMYWQETQDPLTLTAADLPYTIDTPNGANALQPLSIMWNGLPLFPKSLDWLDANVYDWRNRPSDTPRWYYQPDPNTLVIVPAPVTSATITIRIAYTPTRDSTSVVATTHQYYLEQIAAGALAKLVSIPGKPWSAPGAAGAYKKLFDVGVTAATIEANKSYDRSGLRVQARHG